MSMILSWILFPLVLAALGLGWGALVEWASGERTLGALAIPLGLAAVIVVCALLTAFSGSAPAAAPVAAAGGALGLVRAWRRVRIAPAAAIAAVGVLAIYGAPVILSGQATFLGYVKLDDTATWLGFIDQFFTHGRSVAALPVSTFHLLIETNFASGYPSGAFMLAGVGHWITGIDSAWIFQPYMGVCAALLALCCWELSAPLVPSPWLRAFVAFIAAQSALLFGYAAWGGVKELTAAFLLALGVATTVRVLEARPVTLRSTVALGVAAAAFIDTLGPGALVYVGPVGVVVLAILVWQALRRGLRAALPVLGAVPLTAALMLPAWLTVSNYVQVNSVFASSTADHATQFGNLVTPLRAVQLAGIWLYGDFRDSPGAPASVPNHLLIWCVLVAAVFALAWGCWKRRLGISLYVGVALAAVAVLSTSGTDPWLMGKSLSISSPAVLLAGLVGAAILFSFERIVPAIVGVVLLGAIAGGVIWSNYLQYRAVTIAPRVRLAELQKIGTLLAGKGPTFFNEYEIYGDRHFLRAGAPIEPAEYRPENLPTFNGVLLTDYAWANIDSFPLSTLAPYRSLVIRVGPTESRPPSSYREVYAGTYYELWQQPAHPSERVVEHVPLGDSNSDVYCGIAQIPSGASSGLCPIRPAAIPSCPQVLALGRTAAADGGALLAYERTNPIVVRGTDTQFSSGWSPSLVTGSLTGSSAGATAVARVSVPRGARSYQLWLGGSFQRGFDVKVDGRELGGVSNALDPIGAYERIGAPLTLAAGPHTVTITYPNTSLAPGSDDLESFTVLSAIALAPPAGEGRLLRVAPARARTLCGRSLDWIEVVAPA